ncbi:hypothetical protein [Caballeronia sp. KNU42]
MRTVADIRRNAASLEVQGVLARLLDVTLIVLGAVAASICRSAHGLRAVDDWNFVAFSVACALFLFPLFGVYRSWRGRSKLRLAGHISVAWLVTQACAVALMFALHWSGLCRPRCLRRICGRSKRLSQDRVI